MPTEPVSWQVLGVRSIRTRSLEAMIKLSRRKILKTFYLLHFGNEQPFLTGH